MVEYKETKNLIKKSLRKRVIIGSFLAISSVLTIAKIPVVCDQLSKTRNAQEQEQKLYIVRSFVQAKHQETQQRVRETQQRVRETQQRVRERKLNENELKKLHVKLNKTIKLYISNSAKNTEIKEILDFLDKNSRSDKDSLVMVNFLPREIQGLFLLMITIPFKQEGIAVELEPTPLDHVKLEQQMRFYYSELTRAKQELREKQKAENRAIEAENRAIEAENRAIEAENRAIEAEYQAKLQVKEVEWRKAIEESLSLAILTLISVALLTLLLRQQNQISLNLISLLIRFLPEECFAELEVFHQQLKSEHYSNWKIRRIMFQNFLMLFWVFNFQIKFNNLFLPPNIGNKRIDD